MDFRHLFILLAIKYGSKQLNYWEIRMPFCRAKVIDQLSVDLQKRYGSDCGYSVRNLKYMRQFTDEYPDFPFVQVPLAQLQETPFLQVWLSNFTVWADGRVYVSAACSNLLVSPHFDVLQGERPVLYAFYMTEADIRYFYKIKVDLFCGVMGKCYLCKK